MEYKDMIAKAQQSMPEAPATDSLVQGVFKAEYRRKRQLQWSVSMVIVILVCGSLAMLVPASEPLASPLLAEQVSASIEAGDRPAPLAGYCRSVRNRQIVNQIFTLI